MYHLQSRIRTFQFYPCSGSGKSPLDLSLPVVCVVFASGDMASQCFQVGDPPILALSIQRGQFDLRHVEPTTILRWLMISRRLPCAESPYRRLQNLIDICSRTCAQEGAKRIGSRCPRWVFPGIRICKRWIRTSDQIAKAIQGWTKGSYEIGWNSPGLVHTP